MIHVGALAAVAAGILRVAGAVLPADQASLGLAVLYLMTDVGITLGLIAWYWAQQASVGAWGTESFVIAIVGVELIRSNGSLPGLALYPPGALLVVVSVDLLAILAWRGGQLPAWVPGLLVLSAITGLVGSIVPELGALFVFAGGAFGVGFVGVGSVVWRAARHTDVAGRCAAGPRSHRSEQ